MELRTCVRPIVQQHSVDSINQSTNNQSINRFINQSINQSIDQSINQSINQRLAAYRQKLWWVSSLVVAYCLSSFETIKREQRQFFFLCCGFRTYLRWLRPGGLHNAPTHWIPRLGEFWCWLCKRRMDRRYMTAVNLYTEGIQLLVDGVRGKNSLVNSCNVSGCIHDSIMGLV